MSAGCQFIKAVIAGGISIEGGYIHSTNNSVDLEISLSWPYNSLRYTSMASRQTSRRNSSSLNPTPSPVPSQYFVGPLEDDYDYHDTGPSHSPTNPKHTSGDLGSVDASDDPEQFADDLRTHIYEKAISSNRAKLPDDLESANVTIVAQGQPTAPATASISPKDKSAPLKRKKRTILSALKSPITGSVSPVHGNVPRSADKTILRKVALHWSREEDGGVGKISLSAQVSNNNASTGSENSVLWQ